MSRQVPLSTFRAFDAAARTGSFTAAANELGLTPSAVSHAIRKLEQGLGVALFERDARGIVQLTPHGDALKLHVANAFGELRRALDVVSTHSPGLLRLHCAPSFAFQWLMPRLPRLLQQCPGIDVHLSAGSDYMAQFQSDQIDADLVYGVPARTEGFVVIPLGSDTILPLCTPEQAKSIREPADLQNAALIEGYNRHVRWAAWFAANGLVYLPRRGLRFDRSHLTIAAATYGMGVVLESLRLAERELASGQLVAPLQGRAKDLKVCDYYLVFPEITKNRWSLQLFISWLQAEIGPGFGAAPTTQERDLSISFQTMIQS